MGFYQKLLLFLLLLLLPSQLAFHFWPSWSLVNGIRVDYLSPTIYLTDIIIIGLFISSRLRIHISLPVIIFIILNTLNSTLPLLTIYKWFRVLEYFWLYKYLTNYYELKTMNSALLLSILWTSALAWIQFIKQSSLGGLTWWLGERTFSVSTPGIAKIALGFGTWDLGLALRPYATLPHPNALAGFLLVSGLILICFNNSPWRPPLKLRGGLEGVILPWAGVVVSLLTVPLTFSRTAIALEILILLIWIQPLIFKILLLFFSFYFLVSITGSAVSIPNRISLNRTALSAIKQSPFFGIGLGNFIPYTLNSLRQPVHNIYLLLVSELGLPAAFAISYWLLAISKKLLSIKHYALSIAILVVATTGLADHYWLTLHQNTLLLVLLLALIKIKSSINYEL